MRRRSVEMARVPDSIAEMAPRSTPRSPAAYSAEIPADVRILRSSYPSLFWRSVGVVLAVMPCSLACRGPLGHERVISSAARAKFGPCSTTLDNALLTQGS
ncbi:hypothetical protein Slala05_25820 [Streptomyces lavendulae subsp. lavendulae]|nr:hypothetical protein Slala05_25820 [Streptomyces lavendulae subsp. lavendulae]